MKNVIDWNTEMRIKAFVIPVVALGTLFVAQAQEVDADALISTLNAEIAQVEKRGKETAPSVQKKDEPADDDTFEIVPAKPVTPNASANHLRRNAVSEKPEVVVTVRGKGETKDEARNAAFRAAVEKAVGVYVDAESLMKNSELVKDRVNTISNADIKKYETIREGWLTSGLYGMEIKAWVEKKAITPKFADVFPEAFASVGDKAETIHVQKVTTAARAADAASLMTAALENVDRMRNWTRLSVVKGKGLRQVKNIKTSWGQTKDVAEIPGKGLYAVRYSMKIDEKAYLEGFLPGFKEKLEKMQEGVSEDALLSADSVPTHLQRDRSEMDDEGRTLLRSQNSQYMGRKRQFPTDLKAFCGNVDVDYTYFVDPVVLSGFPGVNGDMTCGPQRGVGGKKFAFMFDCDKGVTRINPNRSFNMWLMTSMNRSKTSVRCTAYKVPAEAVRAYWRNLYGKLDSCDSMGNGVENLKMKTHERVEIVLLDGDGEEISARIDQVPATLLESGMILNEEWFQTKNNGGVRFYLQYIWPGLNVFNTFFIRPMFVHDFGFNAVGYSTEIQRDVYFPLTDAQLAEVKKVKVRFVGSGK